jgi:translation initiation factor IF-1
VTIGMASKDDVVSLTGVITGINRGGIFNVEVETGVPPEKRQVLARTSGKMKQFMIKLVIGDRVDLEFSPYDLTQGRIVYRHK